MILTSGYRRPGSMRTLEKSLKVRYILKVVSDFQYEMYI